MATWYIFNKEGLCICTMRGAMPSVKDLRSRDEFAVVGEDDLGDAGELEYVDGKIQKILSGAGE